MQNCSQVGRAERGKQCWSEGLVNPGCFQHLNGPRAKKEGGFPRVWSWGCSQRPAATKDRVYPESWECWGAQPLPELPAKARTKGEGILGLTQASFHLLHSTLLPMTLGGQTKETPTGREARAMLCRDQPSVCRATQGRQKSTCANNWRADGVERNRDKAILHVGKLQTAQKDLGFFLCLYCEHQFQMTSV